MLRNDDSPVSSQKSPNVVWIVRRRRQYRSFKIEAKTVSRVPVRGRTAVVNSPWSLTELNTENVDWCVGLQLVIDDKEY